MTSKEVAATLTEVQYRKNLWSPRFHIWYYNQHVLVQYCGHPSTQIRRKLDFRGEKKEDYHDGLIALREGTHTGHGTYLHVTLAVI